MKRVFMCNLFAQLPIVVSYYTKNTPYEKEVEGLIDSCKQFGIEYWIEGIESKGSWEENCAVKPHFIREKFTQLQRPVLWVDADAVFLRPMQFEEFMFADLAFLRDEKHTDPRFCINSATVYINATEKGLEALNLWCAYSEKIWQLEQKCLPFQDQVSLYFMTFSHPYLSAAKLPIQYCKIFDLILEGIDPQEIVIEQRQASRRLHTRKD